MKGFISIALSLLLLSGNIGFTHNTHYCLGMLMKESIWFGPENLDCGMGTSMEACALPESSGNHFQNKPCCSNDSQQFQIDQVQDTQKLPQFFSLEFDLQAGQTGQTPVPLNIIKAKATFIALKPPLARAIYLLQSVFRI